MADETSVPSAYRCQWVKIWFCKASFLFSYNHQKRQAKFLSLTKSFLLPSRPLTYFALEIKRSQQNPYLYDSLCIHVCSRLLLLIPKVVFLMSRFIRRRDFLISSLKIHPFLHSLHKLILISTAWPQSIRRRSYVLLLCPTCLALFFSD